MSDYLWDKSSAEPDPELERLEELLGEFRYQPRRLTLPASCHRRRRHYLFFQSKFAQAAASLILVVLAALAWSTLRRHRTEVAKHLPAPEMHSPEIHSSEINPSSDQPSRHDSSATKTTGRASERREGRGREPAGNLKAAVEARRKQSGRALNSHPATGDSLAAHRPAPAGSAEYVVRDEMEVERAAKQLMLALYISSHKLNSAQKRTQTD